MARLIGRLLWVFAALTVATAVAALVFTFGILRDDVDAFDTLAGPSGAAVLALTTVVILGYVLLPAALVIALAEGYRLRSALFYACIGLAAALLFGSSSRGELGSLAPDRETEMLAASGIAAGLAYWLLAGRRAGAWRDRTPIH